MKDKKREGARGNKKTRLQVLSSKSPLGLLWGNQSPDSSVENGTVCL